MTDGWAEWFPSLSGAAPPRRGPTPACPDAAPAARCAGMGVTAVIRRRERTTEGGLVIGAILLLVGGYYLLQQTFGVALPDLDWNRIWPVILIFIGASILVGAYGRSRRSTEG